MLEGCALLVLILMFFVAVAGWPVLLTIIGTPAFFFGVWKLYKNWSDSKVSPNPVQPQPPLDPKKDAEIRELIQRPIFIAVAIFAKFAKADGVVTQKEVDLVEDFLRDLDLTGEDRRDAISIFTKHKAGVLGYEESLGLLAEVTKDEQGFRRSMCEMLLRLAHADGGPSRNSEQNVHLACQVLSIDYALVLEIFLRAQRQEQETIQADFEVLGCSPHDSIDVIKKRFRELTKTFHPDTLAGKDLPQGIVEIATEKWREIQEAYERILTLKNSQRK